MTLKIPYGLVMKEVLHIHIGHEYNLRREFIVRSPVGDDECKVSKERNSVADIAPSVRFSSKKLASL